MSGGDTKDPEGGPDEFRSFLIALATDPAKLGAFLKDPDAAMQGAGIDEVDQVVLKSGHPATIHARLMGQRFSFTPPPPVAMLVVDMARAPGASTDQPVVRTPYGSTGPTQQGSSPMFPNTPLQIVPPQIYPQVHPQVVVHPQIYPQIHPQVVVHPQIYPQIHPPQIVVHPQIYPQVHPQLVIFPQIHPQIFPTPNVYPQYYPQVHPQLVIHPPIHPTIHPTIYPNLTIHPLIYYPQIFPIQPQLLVYTPAAQAQS